MLLKTTLILSNVNTSADVHKTPTAAVTANPPPHVNHDDIRFLQMIGPPVALPKFLGMISKRPNFRDPYISWVHESNLPAIKKHHTLRDYLKGEALDIVKSTKVTTENYDEVWEKLRLYYEHERCLVQAPLTELFNVQPMRNDSSSEVKRVLNEILAPIDALTLLGRKTKDWTDIVVFIHAS